MDPTETLRAFDAEMRADPPLEPGARIDRTNGVVTVIAEEGWVSYFRFDALDAERIVEERTQSFRALGTTVEWKVYAHDRPAELGDRLRGAGYVADPTETLMVHDLSTPGDFGPAAEGVSVERVGDLSGLSRAVAVSEGAFGMREKCTLDEYGPRLGDPSLGIFLASVDGTPASAGRLEMPAGRSFAGIWGGGTRPELRRRGAYRALVAARAAVARARGFRYLLVEALPTSRPILERVGFVPLTTVTGWVLAARSPPYEA